MIGFSDLLTERVADDRTRKLAEAGAASARDLLEKVDALIELARADAVQRPSATAEFDLHAAVTSVAAAFGLRCDLAEPLGRVRGCEEELRQVLADVCRAVHSEPGVSDAVLTARTEQNNRSRKLILRIPGEDLARRVRALGGIFGEVPRDDTSRYQQQPLDFRLAVARTRARRLGGDLAAAAGEAGVELSFSFDE
jgi:hypothetical protein